MGKWLRLLPFLRFFAAPIGANADGQENDEWEPWMKKSRLYEAMREKRYIRITYAKQDTAEFSIRTIWPRKISKGKLAADDVTPGKEPGFKYFILDRITYVELLPKGWTPLDLGHNP